MAIYFFTIFILFLFSILEVVQTENKRNNLYLIISYFLMVFVIGLRWETGTDWDSYLGIFSLSGSVDDLKYYFSGMEVGYLFLNYLVYKFSENYTVFLVIHALIFYGLIIRSFQKLVPYPQVAIFLFFCINIGITGSNRQLIAVAICMTGFTQLIQRNNKFFLYVFGGFLFHTTAILFAIYFFFNRNVKSFYLYLSILIAIIVGQTTLPTLLFTLFGIFGGIAEDKAKIYSEILPSTGEVTETLSVLGLFKRLIFVVIFIVLRTRIIQKVKSYNIFLNGYIFGVIFYFLFSSTLLIMVNRGSIYFNIVESILLSLILVILNRNIDKIVYLFVLLIVGIVLFYQSMNTYPDLFDPYKGLFINSEFYRRMY